MIETKLISKRYSSFWNGVSEAKVKEYREELIEAKENVEKLT